ncbi:MAG TPA: class I SAM-dependent methyltransferase [Candidatus Limnocylindrales bacterium]|nr:class I SAM-dependent methyltransferase [Candidatus Limnocylindrales bacterium]
MSSTPVIRLRGDKERSLLRRHPWIFSGAILREDAGIEPGQTVDVVGEDHAFLARGAYSPSSQIRVRVWTFEEDETVDEGFLRRRLQVAMHARRDLVRGSTAVRMVNAESDGLPGLVVDRYGDVLVCQFLSAGVEAWRAAIIEALADLGAAACLYERSDAEVRAKEGLEQRSGLLRGQEPPALVEVVENERRYLVDVRRGHKTGFYIDQRSGRDAAQRWAGGRSVLNAFSYTGGFAVAALRGGAAGVLSIDSSRDALELARRNLELNGLADERSENVEGDVFALLRRFRDARRSFDMIVLDPPKFAESRAQLDRAARGYKDINLLAFKLLSPGGVLLTFSCSGLMQPELFQKIVADAALDARRDAQILERLEQPPDHPVATTFPEGGYLKGLVCRVA